MGICDTVAERLYPSFFVYVTVEINVYRKKAVARLTQKIAGNTRNSPQCTGKVAW